MLALLVVLVAVACQEIGMSIGKREAERHNVGIYSLGFLNMLWGALFMVGAGLFAADGFRFDPASLPTLAIRGCLEILQAYASMKALVHAERSTFGFLQIITIPLLLTIDMWLGYPIGASVFAGIALIIAGFIVLFVNHGIGRAGAGWAMLSSVNAAITISLFKYDITHFNSVAFEQTVFLLLLVGFYLAMALRVERVNPLALLGRRKYLIESVAMGVGMVFVSYAYMFAAASVITTAKRSFTVLASIISGKAVFKEKKTAVKLVAFFLTVGGLVLLAS